MIAQKHHATVTIALYHFMRTETLHRHPLARIEMSLTHAVRMQRGAAQARV
jgi:hypothetical protein